MPRLRELLAAAGVTGSGRGTPDLAGDPKVTAVVYDSRRVRPGTVFVAIAGFHADGHAFAREAAAAGAVAVVAERVPQPLLPPETTLLLVEDSRVALSALAASLAGHPSRDLLVAGITGTDGKTTTASLLWSAWRAAGLAAASLTTIDWRCDDEVSPNTTRQTTLEAVELQDSLATLRARGCTHVALETSSHALALHRVDGIRFRCAVYTRVTSEHLELHGDRNRYLAAKARLLQMVGAEPDGIAVLDCTDDFAYPALKQISVATRLTYSADPAVGADVHAVAVRGRAGGVEFDVRSPWGDASVRLKLPGRFNAANSLAAITAACATGAELQRAVAGAEALDHVTGRMERVDIGQPFTLVVDYAHTAESLAMVLHELRETTTGRLWVVFGSAGERDVDKRPAMGAVAARLADRVVITDEDPRGEDRMRILDDIATGARAHGAVDGESMWLIADRAEAIAHAVAGARTGDTVLLAGKGHEGSIITASGVVAWNERGEAERAIRQSLGVPPLLDNYT